MQADIPLLKAIDLRFSFLLSGLVGLRCLCDALRRKSKSNPELSIVLIIKRI